MTKGLSNVVMTVLIVIVTVSLVVLLYSWLSIYTPQTYTDATSSFPTEAKGCLRIESIDNVAKTITIRNCGSTDLEQVTLYVDSDIISSQAFIKAGGVVQMDFDVSEGEHEVFMSSSKATSHTIWVDTRILSFDFFLFPDSGSEGPVC